MAKLYSSEIAVRAAEDSVQIHGGYGFVKDYPAEKFFRDVKLTHHRRGHERDPAPRNRASAAGLSPCDRSDRARRPRPRRRPARPRARVVDCRERGRRRGVAAWRRCTRRRVAPGSLGVTGPPGAGKSTLVDQLVDARTARAGETVGVVAVDPTSPFTGGAILGDRVRMQAHAGDPRRLHSQHGDARTSRRPRAARPPTP